MCGARRVRRYRRLSSLRDRCGMRVRVFGVAVGLIAWKGLSGLADRLGRGDEAGCGAVYRGENRD